MHIDINFNDDVKTLVNLVLDDLTTTKCKDFIVHDFSVFIGNKYDNTMYYITFLK